MATTSFSYEDDDHTISVSTVDETWPELVRHFIHFLKGCGYMFSDDDIVEYFGEQIREVTDACKD